MSNSYFSFYICACTVPVRTMVGAMRNNLLKCGIKKHVYNPSPLTRFSVTVRHFSIAKNNRIPFSSMTLESVLF